MPPAATKTLTCLGAQAPGRNMKKTPMKIKTTIIAAITAFTINAQARIDETMEEAIARYGEPIERSNAKGWTVFQKGKFQVNVTFYQGQIDTIEYIKWGSRAPVEMSETEANNLLKANFIGEWFSCGHNEWTTSEGTNVGLIAIKNYQIIEEDYMKSYYRLIIMTIDAAQRWSNNVAAKETTAQAGF